MVPARLLRMCHALSLSAYRGIRSRSGPGTRIDPQSSPIRLMGPVLNRIYRRPRYVARVLHFSNLAVGGVPHARGRGCRGLQPPEDQREEPSSADEEQYLTSVSWSPTYTSSQTLRSYPSTNGSRWLETNH